MGESVLRVKFPYHKACDVCHKARREMYRIELDGVPVYVCNGEEAQTATDRWMEKKRLNINPYQPKSMKEEPLMEEGGIPGEGDEL